MTRVIAPLLILLTLAAGIYSAQAFGLGEGNRFGRLGFFKKNGASGPPPVCAPGGPTGQMDFSVCSNIAITAAAMP
jgi:hypothetical protein